MPDPILDLLETDANEDVFEDALAQLADRGVGILETHLDRLENSDTLTNSDVALLTRLFDRASKTDQAEATELARLTDTALLDKARTIIDLYAATLNDRTPPDIALQTDRPTTPPTPEDETP